MGKILNLNFDDQDIKVLDSITVEDLKKQIYFMLDYKEVLWSNSEYPDPMPLQELRKKHSNIQSLPCYPPEFLEIGMCYSRMVSSNSIVVDLHEEGFFSSDSIVSLSLGTLYSPSLIAIRIADAYYRDRFCDGLFGEGVEDGLYLKMLLHLLDCKVYYEHQKKQK